MTTRRSAPADHTSIRSTNTRMDLEADDVHALAAADIDAILPGERIGRYMVLEVIGSGGIGIVYAAYDPDLDRKVALKLLRRSKLSGASEAVKQRRGRLHREAMALARLSHPNVVPVYEVATFDEQIYVAMEFVEGSTLGEWLAERPRSWSEIVALFVQAGRGLAAAHAADIVHRDFKPDNVRVGTDGRVRVLDFGLAGPLREGDPDLSRTRVHERSSRPDSQDSGDLELEDAVTREGQVMGTPAYMAPEQAAGALVDARSDQFSFCVALYEAIYGERPFAGRHDDPRRYRDLTRARSLPGYRPPDLPSEVERVILRGLSLEPDRRFEDMDALLAELAAVAEGPRRLWWVPVSILLLAIVAVVAFYEQQRGDEAMTCDDGGRMLAGVWDPGVAAELRAAVLESKQPYADETWATVERTFDQWAQRWRRARQRACQATHVDGNQSAELLERRFACLDRQLIRLESTIGALRRLEQRPEVMLERLTPMLGRLPSPEGCAGANILGQTALIPAGEADAVEAEAIREQLAAVEGLIDVGEFEQAIERGGEALERARTLGFEAVTAEALLTLGLALDEQKADRDGAAELLQDAAWAAERSSHERALVRAAAAVAGNLGTAQAKLELAAVWAELARAAFVRLGDDPEIEIELRSNLGHIAMARGDYGLALDELGRARDLARERGEGHPDHIGALLSIGDSLRELGRFEDAADVLNDARLIASEALGDYHPMVPELLDALGNVEASRGRVAEALELHKQSLAINEAIHGPDHRSVAKNLNNLAIIYDETGRYQESVETLERARGVLVNVLGPDHPDVAFVDVNLGSALQHLDRYREAIDRYVEALSVLEDSFGSEHMAVGVTLQNLGSARAALAEHGAALGDYARAEAVLERSFGEQHPSLAELEINRARSLRALSRHDEALAADQRALAIAEAVYGHDHAALVTALTSMSETELGLGHPKRARELGERALELADDSNTADELALAQLALAKALAADTEADEADRARARSLGRTALAGLEAAEGGDRHREQVLAWLREQGEGGP